MQRSPKPGSRCRNTPVGDHDFQTLSSEPVHNGTILALRTDPPEVLALTLSAPQTNARISSLLSAIALRYQVGGRT